MREIELIMNVRDLSDGRLHFKGAVLNMPDDKAQLWVETLRVAKYIDDPELVIVEENEQEVSEDE